jgi:hypothetical protein
VEDSNTGRPKAPTLVLLGLLALVRADAIVLSSALYVSFFLLTENKRRLLLLTPFFVVLPLGHWLFRWSYYGDLWPNTAYLKVFGYQSCVQDGLRMTFEFVICYFPIVLFAALGTFRPASRWHRWLNLTLLAYIGWFIVIGGEVFEEFRYVVPIIPLLMISSFVSIERCFSDKAFRLAFLILCLALTPGTLSRSYVGNLHPYFYDKENVRLGVWLKDNVPPGCKVADTWAGSVFYFSGVRGIDLLGKCDAVVARLHPVAGLPQGHAKFDFEYSLWGLKPDFVVGPYRLGTNEGQIRGDLAGPWAHGPLLWLDPVFRSHCFPYPVTCHTWRTVFVCDWSRHFKSFFRAGQCERPKDRE